MNGVRGFAAVVGVILLGCPTVAAQTSASYRLTESVLNSGGDPRNGSILQSASFQIRLDALGESVVGTGGASASYRVDAAFVSAYPPPGEVENLRFTSASDLIWNPERSAGTYDLYRDSFSALPGGGTGMCLASNLTGASASDTQIPPPASGYFYLATSENRLGEEGTKGFRSDGAERPNPVPCP